MWIEISSREQNSMFESWAEFLCVRQDEQGWEIGVLGHEVLEEVPEDWFDDNGQPVSSRCDADGDLVLPDIFEGQEVTGIENRCFVGGLVPVTDDAVVTVKEMTLPLLLEALSSLAWDQRDAQLLHEWHLRNAERRRADR